MKDLGWQARPKKNKNWVGDNEKILEQDMARRVVNIEQEHGDILIKIEIEAKPRNLIIVQVYMLTTNSDDEEIEQIYEKIENVNKIRVK